MATIHEKREFLRLVSFDARRAFAVQNPLPNDCQQCAALNRKRISEGKPALRSANRCPHPSHWPIEQVDRAVEWVSGDPVLNHEARANAKVSGIWFPTEINPSPKPKQKPKPDPKPSPKGDGDEDSAGDLAKLLRRVIRDTVGDLSQETIDALTKRVDALENRPDTYKGLEIKTGAEPFKIEGTLHKAFPELLKILLRRRVAYGFGPAGTGKTHMTGQLAEAIGKSLGRDDFPWECQSISIGTSEADLTGRLLPVKAGGEWAFVPAPLLQLAQKGGLYAADEFDNGDPNVLVILNSMLANGYFTVPANIGEETVKVHEEFYFVAWGNTVGTGADSIYSAREQIDGATRDRFAGSFVFVGYDDALERQIILAQCGGDSAIADETQEFIKHVRRTINDAGLDRICSMRMARSYAQDRACGDDAKEVRARCLIDWANDDVLRLPEVARP